MTLTWINLLRFELQRLKFHGGRATWIHRAAVRQDVWCVVCVPELRSIVNTELNGSCATWIIVTYSNLKLNGKKLGPPALCTITIRQGCFSFLVFFGGIQLENGRQSAGGLQGRTVTACYFQAFGLFFLLLSHRFHPPSKKKRNTTKMKKQKSTVGSSLTSEIILQLLREPPLRCQCESKWVASKVSESFWEEVEAEEKSWNVS